MSANLDHYTIQKNGWPKFGRMLLLWSALAGNRLQYFGALLSLSGEAFFTFLSPLIVKLTIDSVLGEQQPVMPAPLMPLARLLFGSQLTGGGVLPVPAEYALRAADQWPWRLWLRENLWALALAFIACILLQALFGFLASYNANAAAEHTAKRLRDRMYGHIQDLPYESLLRAHSGDWLQRCTSDVDTVRRFVAFESFELVRTLLLIGFAFPVMLSLSPVLTAWGSLVIPVIVIFSVVFHRIVEKVFLEADEREGVLSGIIQENVTGIRVVRAFARQLYETARFGRANDRYRDQVYRLLVWLALYWGLTSFLGLVQLAAVLWAGLGLMAAGAATLGLVVLFLTYEQQVLWPVRQCGRILADAGKAKVALGRMAELLSLPVEGDLDTAGDVCPCCQPRWQDSDIEFRSVSFTYPDGTAVLKDVSFTVKQGEVLAIVGPTGSGKSTLVHLLTRLYEPSSGAILIGGIDITRIPKRVLRRNIALVLQEGFLFGKTIRENISMANPGIDDDRIVAAARHAALDGSISEFPGGWDTMVGERGVTLSGGQRQRLALARALVRDAPVLVLDDSLSAVDTETDSRIREALSGQKATTLIIAHRLTTLAGSDRILVLEDGRVTALGTHRQLMARPGLYRRLAALQEGLEHEGAV